MLNPYAVFPLIALVINATLGIYIINKNPKSRVNQIFTLLLLGFVLWDIGEAVANSTLLSKDATLTWVKIKWIGVSFMGGFYLHFALIFPEKRIILENKFVYVLLYLPCIVFLCLDWGTDLLIKGVAEKYWGYFEIVGVAFNVFSLYFEIVLILGVYLFYKAYKTSELNITKHQAKYTLIGGLIPIVGGSITDITLPLMGVEVVPLASIFTAATGVFIAYAIVRYKMFVAESVIGFSTASYCGVNCQICKKFIDRSCLGCKNDPKHEECAVYLCTQKKKIEDCSFCAKRVSCKILLEKAFTDFMPMPKYYMRKGIYLIKESKAEHSFRVFVDTISMGAKGLCITRQYPQAVREKYGLKMTPILWLSTVQGENNIEPTKIERLSSVINDFISKSDDSIVLLDGLEYLITHNDFHSVLRLMNFISEGITMKKSCLVISVNPLAFKEKELALLERDVTVLDADKIKT